MATAEETEVSQYVPGFKANLNLAPQQKSSKLLNAVDSELSYSESGTEFNADDIQPSDPQDTQGRAADTPDKHLAKTRRIGFFSEFDDSAWIDNVDKTRELEDPTSKVMTTLTAGRWRKVDNTILRGALGVAYERPNGLAEAPTAVNFPGGQTILANDTQVKHQGEILPDDGSDYGLSVGKILYAGLLLDDSEIDEEGGDEKYMAADPMQKVDLLQRTPVTSTYYSALQALVEGKVDEFAGFTFIWLPRARLELLAPGSAVRRCVAWKKPALVYKGREITTANIAIRTDKSHTPQAYYKAQHGVSRRYDHGVVEIQCKETIAKAA